MIYKKQYKKGYHYLDYDDVYNKIYHCPVYYYEWETNFRSPKTEAFMEGYMEKVNEIRDEMKPDIIDLLPQCEFSPPGRTVAIGDIHGDWRALTYSLHTAKVIDENGKWIGGNAYVVQLGDCTDRYRALENNEGRLATKTNEKSEQRILNYLWGLDKQAKQSNGRVITYNWKLKLFFKRFSKSMSHLWKNKFQ